MEIRRDLTGASEYKDIQIEKAAAKIGISIRLTIAQAIQFMIGLLGEISIVILTKDGRENVICSNHSIFELFDFAQFMEGFIRVEQTSTHWTFRGEIDLAGDGSIELLGNEYISLALTKIPVDAILSISTVELPILTRECYKYNKGSLTIDERNKSITNNAHLFMILPKAGFQELKLDYNINNKPTSSRLSQSDLVRTAEQTNDINIVYTDPSTGTSIATYGAWYNHVLNISQAHSLEINTDGLASYKFTTIEEQKL